jgi:hypothetical protein
MVMSSFIDPAPLVLYMVSSSFIHPAAIVMSMVMSSVIDPATLYCPWLCRLTLILLHCTVHGYVVIHCTVHGYLVIHVCDSISEKGYGCK